MNKINLILQEMLDAKPEYVTPLTLSKVTSSSVLRETDMELVNES